VLQWALLVNSDCGEITCYVNVGRVYQQSLWND